MGDFYVSAIICRHTGILVAILLHHLRDKESHSVLFRRLKQMCSWINSSKTIIITDREKGLVFSINQELNEACHVFCWNHLLRNIKEWLFKVNGTDDDKVGYRAHIEDLLKSKSSIEFNLKLEKHRTKWSELFSSYFDAHIKDDLKKSIAGRLAEIGLDSRRRRNHNKHR